MDTYVFPMFFYTSAGTPAEAARIKQSLEQLLGNPMLKQILESNRIPSRGFIIQDPQLAPK